MSRVLARNMFKKKAPKRSAKGVGITSMLEDDVPGYAEGGEVTDDRTERERLARQLLEQSRDEGEGYQRFSEQERPRMYRPPATMPAPPQPNPQQMQAMQMQQMAQMGMIPRFQEGGFVQRQPLFGWGSRIRGWSEPNPATGSPGMDNPEFRYREPAMPLRDMPYTDPMGAYTGGMEPVPPTPDQGFNIPIPDPLKAALGQPVFTREEKAAPSEADQAAMEADRETRRGKGLGALPFAPTKKEQQRVEGGPGKKTDIDDIKLEREAKAAERQALADAGRKENMWLALMQAGLAIAGGRSPNAITNIGQGGQAGLASFMALEQQRRRDEDAAMRRAVAEREVNLQERRLNMMAPVYSAQAEAYRARPALAAAQLQARQQQALGQVRVKAIEAVRNEVNKNPMAYMKNGKVDEMAVQLAIQQRQNEMARALLSSGGVGYAGGSADPLGLGLGGPDDEE